MARYKAQERHSLRLPVVLSEQVVPGSFAFALNHLVHNKLELIALDAQLKNDGVGASACDPRARLRIVLLARSQGLISSPHRGLAQGGGTHVGVSASGVWKTGFLQAR